MSFLRQNPLRASSSLAILALAAALGSCRGGASDDPGNLANAADEPVMNAPALPLPEPALDRAGLLAAVASAASASALGLDQQADQRRLDGRQFEVRIRFGCRGASADLGEAWLGWTRDVEQNALRVRAQPTVSLEDPLVSGIAGEQVEAVEGFWIPRPWLMRAACPAGAATAPPQAQEQAEAQTQTQESKPPAARAKKPAAPDQDAGAAAEAKPRRADPVPVAPRVGIAQFFTKADARTGRRDGRAYEAVKTLEPGAPIGSRGFDLVLSGRLQALPGRQVINCSAKSFDQPPECLVSARFDRVWIDQPGTGEVIAEWRAQ